MATREELGQLFRDPRRERIYRRLLLIGEGPAAFYRDACLILDSDAGLSPQVVGERDERGGDRRIPPLRLGSAAHVVGHLFREIESAIRDVLVPIDLPLDSRSGHRSEIKAILKAYELDQHKTLATAWRQFTGETGLQKRAHRDNLAPPRPLDDEAREYFSNLEAVFDAVLGRLEERYDAILQVVDELARKNPPTKADVEVLRKKVPNNLNTLHHFFSEVSHPAWLDLLSAEGMFAKPPEPTGDDDEQGTIMPPWPASQYLARMAAVPELQERVAQIALNVPATRNFRVHEDLADVVLHLPMDLALQFVAQAKTWCQDHPWFSRVSDKIGGLVERFLDAGEVEAALQLAAALFDPENRPGAGLQIGHEAWAYEQSLHKLGPSLVAAGGLGALEIMTSCLVKLLRADASLHLWRPAIEPHEQNFSHGSDARQALINAVRDGAETIVTADPTQITAVVEHLEAAESPELDRIALHLLRVAPNVPVELLKSHLLDRNRLNGRKIWHEYTLLAQSRLGELGRDDQVQIVQWALERAAERAAEEGPGDLREPEAQGRSDRAFEHRALARFREALPEEFRTRYEELEREFGRVEHPEFLSYHSGGVSVGPTSPKTSDELRALPIEELFAFLESWMPEQGWMAPSREGIARELSNAVAAEPDRFARVAGAFQELHPAYVRGFLGGLAAAARSDGVFDWKPVLELGAWAVATETEAGARGEVERLLENAFQNQPLTPPFEFRERVWAIIERLASDAEPTPKYEAEYVTSSESAYDRAINTIRGTAMELAVQYGLWVRRHLGEDLFTLDAAPELRALLEAHLDPSIDPSVAVRSTYGRWLPWIHLLDPGWTVAHLGQIFPAEGGREDLHEAAWDAYILYCSPYSEMLPLLRNEYSHAVSQLQQFDATSRRRTHEQLADHLMVFYLRGQIELQDDLLTEFFAVASESTRQDAIRYVGRVLRERGELEAEIKSRATALWEVRTANLDVNTGDRNLELASFGWWFAASSLDPGWRLAQLERALSINPAVEPDHLVFEEFLLLVEEHPIPVLACVRRMIEGARDQWERFSWRQELRQILERALRSENHQAVRDARDIVNILVARGELEYRALLEEVD